MGLAPERSHGARLARYDTVSSALALLSSRRLARLVDGAPVVRSGIGGSAVLLEIEGTPVFAKRVPLTDPEQSPDNIMSTANVFALPPYCQYRLGAPGFGVWREVAAHSMTTNWVLTKRCESFPLMYHWRVLPGRPSTTPTSDELADIPGSVSFWDGSQAVRARLEAIAAASSSVLLFLEYIPQNLHEWMNARISMGDDAVESMCAMVERELRNAVSFMNSNDLIHFDTHFENILTDGRRLYLTDFGLATSTRFEVSEVERAFLERNRTHDGCHTVTYLVLWLVSACTGITDPADRRRYIRRCADGAEPPGVPAAAAEIIKRYAPIAVVINEFYRKLRDESRRADYPEEEIRRVCAATGFQPILTNPGTPPPLSGASPDGGR
jgi:serine/threonine protein kinase